MCQWRKNFFWHSFFHDDVIKWKHFPCYWTYVREIHRSTVNSPHKGQWRGALMFSLFCAWLNGWVNTREAGDLRRHRAHYDVTAMFWRNFSYPTILWWHNSRTTLQPSKIVTVARALLASRVPTFTYNVCIARTGIPKPWTVKMSHSQCAAVRAFGT